MATVTLSQTRVVSFADLNLDTPEGRIALHERIRANARAACQELAAAQPSLVFTDDVQTCVHQAMLTWMPRAHALAVVDQQ
ncbi:MAG TPA: UrcA family protein [Steroidobacteraceae bacterium]|jgi:UrcA family protein|nr:UrcA family protein [Steroidobacteraceae bacterium]